MAGSAGVATGAGTRVDVTLKLSQLQNLCKRDPDGYREDYEAQVRRLESELGILALQPNHTSSNNSLTELIQFAAAVASSSYKGKESNRIIHLLMNLLVGGNQYSSDLKDQKNDTKSVTHIASMPATALQLNRDIRKSAVSALILMRNKGVVEPLVLMELFFRIMSVIPDKGLREQLYKHMVNDIRNVNKKGKRDDKLNRAVQSFLHRVVGTHGAATGGQVEETATDIAAKRATDMVCELYRRRVWTDDRTVAILASAVESKNTTVMSRAIRFFLGIEEKMAMDEATKQEEEWLSNNEVDFHHHSKKTKSHERQTQRALKNRKRCLARKEAAERGEDWLEATPEQDRGVEASKKLYPAIEMLRDPQGLAENVFKRLRAGSSLKYETKLLMINFVTRLVGNHELLVLPLYSFLQKYMGGHQRDVTAVLAYTVQACHEQVPPDEVYGILKTIAHNFITERCSEEQMAVGINAARAVCARVPSVMSEEESEQSTGTTVMDIEAFARDLAAYAKHRDRSVSIAGKAWTNFVRETNPGLLQGKDRGLAGTALHKSGEKPLRYGEKKVSAGVDGADLLVEYEAKKAAAKAKQGEKNDDDGDEDSGEWEDVDEKMKGGDEDGSGEWEDVNEDEEKGEDAGSDDEAPDLVLLEDDNKKPGDGDAAGIDISKLSAKERDKLKQDISSTRIFSTQDFIKMRKLVEREQKAKRDPREAARRKRAIAHGKEFEELSDDSSADDSDDEKFHIKGVVNPDQIMAMATRKRQSKAERLEKILAGRTKFEAAQRDGGATNVEKLRTKNFMMSKFSQNARSKGRGKSDLRKKRKDIKQVGTHDAKKRRRKL